MITDPKGDRGRRTDAGIIVRGAKLHISAASLVHERVVLPTKSSGDVESRMRVYNLIRNITADALGGWRLVEASPGPWPSARLA